MLALAIFVSLSLGGSRDGDAACHSTCTEQLVACKRTCPVEGRARRDCRTACAQRSTCTAPGAPIRTLAYVLTECRQDPQDLYSIAQKLVVRRGNCDPVTVMEVGPSTPVLDPAGVCRNYGGFRVGDGSQIFGVFQRMAVLPDGSGVIFEMTDQHSFVGALTPKPPEEGIFFVRPDGSNLRRLGDASRFPIWIAIDDGTPPLGVTFRKSGELFPVDPDGRNIVLIDLGPDMAGHEAPQVFLLDLRSGRRKQLTHQSRVLSRTDFGISLASFLNRRTIVFYSGPAAGELFRVETNGKSPETEVPPPTLVSGGHIVPQFTITGVSPHVIQVGFPERKAMNPTASSEGTLELFLLDGKKLLQLTSFDRTDTFGGFVDRAQVLLTASANPVGENPAGICQLFSVNRFGGALRQVTHLPSDGQLSNGCVGGFGNACQSFDQVMLDPISETVLFDSNCDPLGANPFGGQIFSMRPDGTGLRQLTNARGRTIDPDGTVHVELPGPFAYSTVQR